MKQLIRAFRQIGITLQKKNQGYFFTLAKHVSITHKNETYYFEVHNGKYNCYLEVEVGREYEGRYTNPQKVGFDNMNNRKFALIKKNVERKLIYNAVDLKTLIHDFKLIVKNFNK